MAPFGLPWSAAWSVIGVSFLAVGAHMITRSSEVAATADAILSVGLLGFSVLSVGVWCLVNAMRLVFGGVES